MKLILLIVVAVVNGSFALARCKSIPTKHIVGQFEVVGTEGVFVKCANKDVSKSFKKIEQMGCSLTLKLKSSKDGQISSQNNFKIYGRGDICSAKIGSVKDLSLKSTVTECCHMEDESDSGLCEGKGKPEKLKCVVSPNWAIDDSQ